MFVLVARLKILGYNGKYIYIYIFVQSCDGDGECARSELSSRVGRFSFLFFFLSILFFFFFFFHSKLGMKGDNRAMSTPIQNHACRVAGPTLQCGTGRIT